LLVASSYGSDSEAELENLREKKHIASQNILAAAMDSSILLSLLRQGDVASAGGVLKFNDMMSPAEFATFID
jgi:hypothetical protein